MKYPLRTLARLTLLLLPLTLALAGCFGGGSKVAPPKALTKMPSPPYRMKVLWHTDAGGGDGRYVSGFRLAVAGNRVFEANRDGRVVALNIDNGQRIWRTDTGKGLASGPTVVDGTVLVGTRNGALIALSADDGSKQWSADLSSEVLAAPAGAGDTVVARTVDGHIAAFDRSSGKRLWTIEGTVPDLTMRGNASPVIHGDTVYVGMDSGKLLALNLKTGERRWAQTVALPHGRSQIDRIVDVDATPVIDGNAIDAVSAGKSLMSMTLDGGQVRWQHGLSSEKDLASSGDTVFATDMNGVVWAVSQSGGQPVWHQNALEHRKLTAPAVMNGHVLVGDYQGYVHWLSATNGHIQGRGRPFGSAIRAQPVVVGNKALVLGVDGEVAAVRFEPSGG